MPKKEGKKTIMKCSCGYIDKEGGSVHISEKVKAGKTIEVVDKEVETLPTTEAECPKCKNKQAYFWEVQTRAADEPATKFLKCTKCKHIWRDYS